MDQQIEKLHANAPQAPAPDAIADTKTTAVTIPEITIDDFAKLDLRVGTILTAERVEKADKLLKFTVDLGFEIRTILSGIAQHFQPEEVIGKQVCVVANLAPRKIRGIESKGMILLAESEGKLIFVKPENLTLNGSGIR